MTTEANQTIPDCEFNFDIDADDFFAEPKADASPAEPSPPMVDEPAAEATSSETSAPAAAEANSAFDTNQPATTEEENPGPTSEEKILTLRERIADACIRELHAKDLAKKWKDRREQLTEELDSLQKEIEADDEDSDDEDGDDLNSDYQTSDASSPAATQSSPQAVWGTDPVESLASHGLTGKKCESLREAADAGRFNGTIAGLRDWIAKSDLWYRDVKGCGASGSEKIGDALMAYQRANPEPEKPMTAEDERRCEAAAEFLGHTCGEPGGEGTEAPTTGTSAAEAAADSTAIVGGSSEYLVEAKPDQPPTNHPQATKSKRTRKPKAKPAELAAATEAEAEPSTTPFGIEAAYVAGCLAGTANKSCSENPFADRSSPEAKEWYRGWEETSPTA